MTRNSFIIEKLIAILLIIWGGLILYFCINGVRFFFVSGLIAKISFLKFFKEYHLIFLLPVLTILGGSLLMFDNKFGWTISMIALLLNALLFLIPTEKGKSMFTDQTMGLAVFSMTIISMTIFYILKLPVYRDKYRVTNKNWWTIALSTFTLLLDKTYLYWAS